MTTINHRSEVVPALTELGFTEIEAQVYDQLLRSSPATGYRVSHDIGKPTSNTYQAIASLVDKGAVLVDEGEKRLCRAVPPDELLAALGRRFERRRERAEVALSRVDPAAEDERIYRLTDVDQVLERALFMLAASREIVLLDAFPEPLRRLSEPITAAARRGVRVVGKVYGPGSPEGLETVGEPDPEHIAACWPGQQLNVVADGEEHLLALLAHGLTAVHEAIWSRSTYLSCMHHNHLACELCFSRYQGLTGDDPERLETARELESISLLRFRPPGLERLLRKHVAPGPTEETRS